MLCIIGCNWKRNGIIKNGLGSFGVHVDDCAFSLYPQQPFPVSISTLRDGRSGGILNGTLHGTRDQL
ncbi:hypothetical protein BDV39DRAFT_168165, partial [Aspergillus sergii]